MKTMTNDECQMTKGDLLQRLVGADSRIAAVNLMEPSELRQILKRADLQRSVRSCAAVRLQQLEQTELARPKEAGR